MLTKKEKLLIRPWQMQRYYNHRVKVETAAPAIDFHPPAERAHITQKLKKLQKERERTEKIERDNIRLLQRLGAIMSKKRLDNIWTHARPNFLSREYIYPIRPKTTGAELDHNRRRSLSSRSLDDLGDSTESANNRPIRCSACTRRAYKPNKVVPEERMPWAPQRKTSNRKHINEAQLETHVCCRFCCCK
ncbi:uncharacterized protein LOC128744037 [Sabethes cyaneus]|uniref:uncharacterized protein LOC128744037 n=1 Tax=Sabethes cyaneus TaxID=53552 RepID=UPI00237E739E|nr:uncharacterized protein LOC128744037 [Sabethes cyaneus]